MNTANTNSMDRKISKPSSRRWLKIASAAGVVVLCSYFFWQQMSQGRSLTLDGQRLNIATVSTGTFEDFIPVRARVAPLKTVFLDAVQGGRVEEVLHEDGALVEAGQVLLRLSNSELQLSVMSTESRVMEQLNAMRDQELRLEQNRLTHKRALVDINYNILRLQRDLKRQEDLFSKGHLSKANYDKFVDELDYNQKKRKVVEESKQSDERLMQKQLAFFQEKTAIMEDNLAFARKSLEDLHVRASISGRLSGFDAEVGQNVSKGMRIGQIDQPDAFKLSAMLDEFYLGRVDLEQELVLNHSGKKQTLRVSKVYPDVRDGQFQVDFQFIADSPSNIRRGQSLQAKLTLGSAQTATLLPMGTFYADSGGQWVFVVSDDKQRAEKRSVRLGRRNEDVIEVLHGLHRGESVIISSYNNFRDMDTLSIATD